jgi:hypothetical protein
MLTSCITLPTKCRVEIRLPVSLVIATTRGAPNRTSLTGLCTTKSPQHVLFTCGPVATHGSVRSAYETKQPHVRVVSCHKQEAAPKAFQMTDILSYELLTVVSIKNEAILVTVRVVLVCISSNLITELPILPSAVVSTGLSLVGSGRHGQATL